MGLGREETPYLVMSLLSEILATPYNGLYGDDPPEKGYFFQASGILGNLSFGLIKRLKRANRCISWLRQSPENVLLYDLSKFLRLYI